MIIAVLIIVLVLAFVGYLWNRKSSEESARQAAALVEEKRLPVANDEKAKAEPNRINKEKIATDQADTRKTPEANTQAQDVPSFRDWDGSWHLYYRSSEKEKWEETEMELTSDQSRITGNYGYGTISGHFVDGDFSKVTGEYINTKGTGRDCGHGKQSGRFWFKLTKGGRSMEGKWDVCGEAQQRDWKADKKH